MNVHDDDVYLRHILECTGLIKRYVVSGKGTFMNDVLVRDAVLRRLQIMAESTQRLSIDTKAKMPGIDWRALSGFRNVLVHDYLGGIDLERVWEAVDVYLPELERAVQEFTDDQA